MSRTPSSDRCSVRGNRRGGHRQHVDRLPQRFEPLFHFDAETLFLVDDHQAQVGERDVVLGQPMRADDDVDRAVGQSGEDRALLLPACRSG